MYKRIIIQHKLFLIGTIIKGSLMIGSQSYAQEADIASASERVRWLTFEQLDDSLEVKPKKVFINFYADWCSYCHEMDKKTFSNKDVITILNNDYYAVKMNIETADTIRFGEQQFWNKRINKRNPIHEIALLMASRKGKAFSLPAIVVLNEKFEASSRYFQYLSPQQLITILKAE